jgi:hypothetical protein
VQRIGVRQQRRPRPAWPDSWYAHVTRSCSLIVSDLRSAPISTCRAPWVEVVSVIDLRRPLRTAIDAASVDQVGELGAENPGVPRAIWRRSTSGSSATFFA